MRISRRELFGLLAAAPIAAAAADELKPESVREALAEFTKMRDESDEMRVFSIRHSIRNRWLFIDYQAAGRPREIWNITEESLEEGPQTLPGGLQVSAGWYAGRFSIHLAGKPLPAYLTDPAGWRLTSPDRNSA